jgi:hypothetical protein
MTNLDEIRQQMNLLSDEDLVQIHRKHDEEQWRPEVFDIVACILNQRGVSLDKDSKFDGAVLEETSDLATVASYNNDIDAETNRLALESAGLSAWISNRQSYGAGAFVHLQVREEDLEAARQILEPSEPAPSSDLPAEIAEPPCPKCGSRMVTERAEILEPSEIPFPSEQAWLYCCASCGHKWSESAESSSI